MSDYDAKRFIDENTADRRDAKGRPIIVPDTSEDPAPASQYAVIDPVTFKTQGVHNLATATALAKERGHHVLDRSVGTWDPNSRGTKSALHPRSS